MSLFFIKTNHYILDNKENKFYKINLWMNVKIMTLKLNGRCTTDIISRYRMKSIKYCDVYCSNIWIHITILLSIFLPPVSQILFLSSLSTLSMVTFQWKMETIHGYL